MDQSNHQRKTITSAMFWSNGFAFVMVLLAWLSLFSLQQKLDSAIATQRNSEMNANTNSLHRTDFEVANDGGDNWLPSAQELLIETTDDTWTVQDQQEYERLRAKLNPNLITPDYRKPLGQRKHSVDTINF